VFSPYYVRALQRGAADPLDHCALNVALYGAGGKRWALTERGRRGVERKGSSLAIGPSALRWDGDALVIEIDEVTVPVPSRIRGRVRLRPMQTSARSFALDARGRHRWRPIAPCARIDVELERPALRWSGRAYLDSNAGDEPLANAFESWQWSRAALRDGSTAVLYDVARRSDDALSLALRFKPDGEVDDFAPPPPAPLPDTRWRIRRWTRSDPGCTARVVQSFEDTPFYARSLVTTGLFGESAISVHESLSLERFRRGWAQGLLPFRMPRRNT
jgi:carotenoid 1,2-hydratase